MTREYTNYAPVIEPEIVAPIRNTVGFINYKQADIDAAKNTFREVLIAEAFGGDEQ